MAERTMLEQEIYEQMVEQGVDEFSADMLARDAAVDVAEGFQQVADGQTVYLGDFAQYADEPDVEGSNR